MSSNRLRSCIGVLVALSIVMCAACRTAVAPVADDVATKHEPAADHAKTAPPAAPRTIPESQVAPLIPPKAAVVTDAGAPAESVTPQVDAAAALVTSVPETPSTTPIPSRSRRPSDATRGESDNDFRRSIVALKKGEIAAAQQGLNKAAEQGNVAAQYELAMLLKTGRNPVKQDNALARRWFTRAAERGHAGAQFELGQLIEQGAGGEGSCKDVEKWLRKAADKSHTEAMLQLGWLNLRGCGGERKSSEAAGWLKKAAAKGSRDAQFSLGVLYFNGDGVPKDIREARRLLESAAAKGHQSAKSYLDRMK